MHYIYLNTFVCDHFNKYFIAFSQEATGPSSVCEGSNVTLQCRVLFNGNAAESVWFRNRTPVRVGNNFIPNHRVIFNCTTGKFTDLVITNVTLEDNNIEYTCNSSIDDITSSLVLNVSGKLYMLIFYAIFVFFLAFSIIRMYHMAGKFKGLEF